MSEGGAGPNELEPRTCLPACAHVCVHLLYTYASNDNDKQPQKQNKTMKTFTAQSPEMLTV